MIGKENMKSQLTGVAEETIGHGSAHGRGLRREADGKNSEDGEQLHFAERLE